MASYIRNIKGMVASIDRNKKEISLYVKENLSGTSMENKYNFILDPHVLIMNPNQRPMGLVGLKINKDVEIGYFTSKSKMIATYIKVIS